MRSFGTIIYNSNCFVPAAICLGLLARLLVLLLSPSAPISDAGWYVDRAVELANGMGFQEDGYPTAFWPVGWPAILALVYKISGSMGSAIIALNLFASGLVMGSIVWLGRHLMKSELAARLAVLAYALYPASIGFSAGAQSETFYLGLILPAFILVIDGRHQRAKLVGAGLLFGIATLVKSQTYLFPIGLILVLVVAYRDFGNKDALRAAIIVHVCLFAVVLPWSLRNQNVLGEFVLVSTNGGSVMYYAANPDTTGLYIELKSLYPKLGLNWETRVRDQVEQDRKFKEAALTWVRENPLEYLGWMPKKFVIFWAKDAAGFWNLERTYPNTRGRITFFKIVNQIFYLLVLVLAIPCLVRCIVTLLTRKVGSVPPDYPLLLLWCMPAFVTLLALLLTAITRYHYPAMPFVILAAAWTVSQLLTTGNSASKSESDRKLLTEQQTNPEPNA